MKRYIGTKLINAKPMTRQEYNTFRGWELPADENGEDEGFLVEYVDGGKANTPVYDGYVSWSPKDVFGRSYWPCDGMSFGLALDAMRWGAKVARAGWNGKGMWIALGEGSKETPAANFWNRHSRAFAEANGGSAEVLPYILFKTADDKILMGWLASQTDILAFDWQIVE